MPGAQTINACRGFQAIVCEGPSLGRRYEMAFPDDWYKRTPDQASDYIAEIKVKVAARHKLKTEDVHVTFPLENQE